MPINTSYDEDAVIEAVAGGLDEFYTALIAKINELDIKEIMRRKNPYLFRAKAMLDATEIVKAVLAAFVSSSEETSFGKKFFEPVAAVAGQSNWAITDGVDVMAERGDAIYAVAVKSGTSVFNSSSRKSQERDFAKAMRQANLAHKRCIPVVGYSYGRKKTTGRGQPKIYFELAGQEFWYELTGDDQFYIKLIRFMGNLPERYVEEFEQAYQRATNRLVREFTNEFCLADGRIDWEKLVEFNSGR